MLKQQFAVAKTGLLLWEITPILLFSAFNFQKRDKSYFNANDEALVRIQLQACLNSLAVRARKFLLTIFSGIPFGVVMDELLQKTNTLHQKTLIQLFSPYTLRRRVKSYFISIGYRFDSGSRLSLDSSIGRAIEKNSLLAIYPAINLWKRCLGYFLVRLQVHRLNRPGLANGCLILDKYTPQF